MALLHQAVVAKPKGDAAQFEVTPKHVALSYNALSQRTRSYAVSTLYWVYDESINPVYQFDNSTNPNLTRRYLGSDSVDELLADEPVTSLGSGGNTLWSLSDHLGTIRDLSDLNEGTLATPYPWRRRRSMRPSPAGWRSRLIEFPVNFTQLRAAPKKV